MDEHSEFPLVYLVTIGLFLILAGLFLSNQITGNVLLTLNTDKNSTGIYFGVILLMILLGIFSLLVHHFVSVKKTKR